MSFFPLFFLLHLFDFGILFFSSGELGVFKQPEGRAPASQGKAPKYELATHTVRVRRTGSLAEVMALWDLEGTPRLGMKLTRWILFPVLQAVETLSACLPSVFPFPFPLPVYLGFCLCCCQSGCLSVSPFPSLSLSLCLSHMCAGGLAGR